MDFFGYKPAMLYDGGESFTSRYGGVVTITIGMLFGLVAGFSIWRYNQKDSPETNVNKIYVQDPVGFNLTNEILPMAFGLQDPATYGHYIDPTVYTITASYDWYTNEMENGTLKKVMKRTPIPLITCDKAYLDKKYFTNLDLANMFCFGDFKPDGKDLYITGVFESDNFGVISIDIKRCTGATCKDREAIDKKVQGGYFAANYINRDTRTSEYDNPVETYPTSFFTPVSVHYRKENILYMADNEIYTDSPIIGYLPPITKPFSTVASLRAEIADLTVDPNKRTEYFYNLVIRMDHIKSVTQRRYPTAYDFLAEFGGLAQVIMLVGLFLTFRTKKVQLYVDLVQKFAKHEENYQTVLDLHTQMGREKSADKKISKTPISRLKTFSKKDKTGFSSYIKATPTPSKISGEFTLKSLDIQANELSKTGKNNKLETLDLEIPEEGKGNSRIPSGVVAKEFPKKQGKTPPILHKKPQEAAKITADQSTFVKLEKIEEDCDETNTKNQKPYSGVDTTKTLVTVNLEEDHNLEKKQHLVHKIVVSNTKLGAEKLRYDYTNEILRSVTGWKAFIYSLFPCIMKRSRTSAAVEIAENDIYKKFDFVQILHFMEEFQKLKRMILTHDQQILFNLVPNNKLSFKETKEEREFKYLNHLDAMMGREESIENATRNDIVSAFDRIWNQPSHSELDQNLLVSLGFLFYGNRQRDKLASKIQNRPSVFKEINIQ